MSLINSVKAVCDRLSGLGWRELLLRVTDGQLDIRAAAADDLRAALLTPLTTIDRTFPGFVDFSPFGQQGITPGLPGASLLYHALASPGVTLGVDGPLAGFPTLREIEAVEHLVFGIEPPTLEQLAQKAGVSGAARFTLAVFAYEYRPAHDTCTRLHADLAFSRTGVARVGTSAAAYNASHRGFQHEDDADPFAFRVCPARYGLFLAVRRKGGLSTPMRRQQGDQNRDFLVPVHKLFDGDECLEGLTLQLHWAAYHYNDKLRRVREYVGESATDQPPFRITEGIAEFVTGPDLCDGLVLPIVHARLVEPARHDGAFLTYRVPPAESYFAAFEPRAVPDNTTNAEVRPVPAYVHARTEVRDGQLFDLGRDPARPDVLANVSAGNYDALLYSDFTGEGQIDVQVDGLGGLAAIDPEVRTAYSLITAPDFFPSTGQRELTQWTQSPEVPPSLRGRIWGEPPIALCDTRLPANLQMPGHRFDAKETTITAVVPLLGTPTGGATPPVSEDARRHSCLPDDAAGVFAPGWDVATDRLDQGGERIHHLAAYGLGSPFPEDAKLCAALSTYWPTVAPDIARGMSINPGAYHHTVAPMTDDEIGQVGTLPWDGNPGPRLVTINGQRFVECESFMHVDYVESALERRFTARLTGRVHSDEYKRRVLAMAFVYAAVGFSPELWFVLSFLRVLPGDAELQKAQIDTSTVLQGAVYRVDMFRASAAVEQASPTNFRKRLLPITDRRFFFVDPRNRLVLARREDEGLWSRAPLNV